MIDNMDGSVRTESRRRKSRIPAQTTARGRLIVTNSWRWFHPELGQLDEYGMALVLRPDPVPELYAWTMFHPEFREAQESQRSADTLLLATTKIGRELAQAAIGKLPGGWSERETLLFWLCELRYPYQEERVVVQATVRPQKLQAFRQELKRRRNNARKRIARPAPGVSDPVTGELILVDPLRADLPTVPALIIFFWTWRPLWLSDSGWCSAGC